MASAHPFKRILGRPAELQAPAMAGLPGCVRRFDGQRVSEDGGGPE